MKYTVYDFYENPFGEAVFVTDEKKEAEKFCDEYCDATDWECNLVIKER